MGHRHYCFFLGIAWSVAGIAQHPGPDSVVIDLVRWDAKYTAPRTVSSITTKRDFRFTVEHLDIDQFFVDADDCDQKLSAYAVNQDSSVHRHRINAGVTFWWAGRRLDLYFDNYGNYQYRGVWHQPHWGIYHLLFKYFSAELTPPTTLAKAKEQQSSSSW